MKSQNKNKIKYQKVLVTGPAGFIGFHFTKKLLALGFQVIGIDNLNSYYDVNLKYSRLGELGFSEEQINKIKNHQPVSLKDQASFNFYPYDIKKKAALKDIFSREKPELVVNIAAQAGVRYSLKNPYAYINSNIHGFINILENCKIHKVKHLVFASSSSVYGSNEEMPFSVHQNVDHPVSLYAATKKSNELMAHAYSHLYKIPCTGLRFFTVYGAWGRPDMSYYIFTKNILNNIPIKIFNYGDMKRDFTYIDDIVEAMVEVMQKIPKGNKNWNGKNPDPASSSAPYRLFNIGNNSPVDLLYLVELIEKNLGRKALKKLLPMQKGDVKETFADTQALKDYINVLPVTPVEKGIANFVDWYLSYHGIKRPREF
jgi:UDP-glucuronate 4-epimerase